MDATLGDYLRYRRYIGSKDRSEIVERVYAIVRSRARLGWWIGTLKNCEDSERVRVIAHLLLAEGKSLEDLCGLFDGSKYGPEKLSPEEQEMIRPLLGQEINHPDMSDCVRAECPEEYESELKQLFSDKFDEEMAAIQCGAPLDMRVNIWRADRDKVIRYLEADGVKSYKTEYCPWGVRAEGKAFLSRTKPWQKGWIEIQDEGSQLIAFLCDARPGMQVLDYCAGAGGKTLALAASMQNKGRMVAMDIDPRRLAKAAPRLKKAGLHDIVELRSLDDVKNRKWLRRQKEYFDLVLLDVPCSGTGTWRRNPDMKWRQYGPDLSELKAIQAEILEKNVSLVKPGGRIVYATCSLLRQENEEQVEHFLEEHPEFTLMPFGQAYKGDQLPCESDYMRLTPYRHNTDGFFAAVLQKKM
jgi:16S rRNA (cytosine967-C5)-methyltransferase